MLKKGRQGMTKTGWQRNWIRITTTLLTAAVMIMIFCFSMENAEQSDQRSGVIADILARIIHPDYDQMESAYRQIVYDEMQHIVRKGAHFTEYTLLGFLIRLCLESWFGHRTKRSLPLLLTGFCTGTAYACTDEAHQLTTEGRTGAWADVLVDAGGVLTGVFLGSLLIRLTMRKSAKKHEVPSTSRTGTGGR